MAIKETAESRVNFDGRQAEEGIRKLQVEAKALKDQMRELRKANDASGMAEVKKRTDENAKAQRALKQELFGVDSVMKNLSGATMKQLQGAQRALTAELSRTTRGTQEYIAKSQQLRLVTAEMKKVRAEMSGMATTQGGMFNKMANGFNKYFGLIAGGLAALTGLSMGFRKLAQDANEFQSRVANLSALTGLEGGALDWLEEKAKSLSVSVTDDGIRITKSADDIVDAFTLMGSAKPELLKNKEALALVTTEALKLAEAAKMDTKTAVESLANVMNQFGAGSDQATRYINVLAAGSKEGAAAVDSIAASIIKFGPAAAGANISVEQSVGLIETLAEKGLKGEIAGTQLRTALLKLQTGVDKFNPKVVGLNQALENLSKENLNAGDLVKIFGQEAYTAGAILINNKDQVDYYTKAVTGTNVATEQAVKNTQTMTARLEQARNKFKLASLDLGQRLGGALLFSTNLSRKFISAIIDVDKAFVRWRHGLPRSFSDAAVKIKEEQDQVNALVMRLTDANTKESERKKIIEELNAISPTLIKNINSEKVSMEQLRKNLEAYNEAATNRIILANLEAEEQKELSRLAEQRQKVAERQFHIQQRILSSNKEIALSEGTFNEKLQQTISYLEKQVKAQEASGAAGRISVDIDFRTDEQKMLQVIKVLNNELINDIKRLDKMQSQAINYQERINALKELLGLKKSVLQTTEDDADAEKDGAEDAAKSLQNELKTIEEHFKRKKIAYLDDYNSRRIGAQKLNFELETLETALLYAKLALHKQYGEDVIDIELQIAEKVRGLTSRTEKAHTDMLDKVLDAYKKTADEIEKNYFQRVADDLDEVMKQIEAEMAEEDRLRSEQLSKRIAEVEQYKAITESLATSMGDLIGKAIVDAEMTQAEFAKRLVLIFLDATHSIVRMALAQIWAQALASPDSIATWGVAGSAKAIAISALVEGAFAATKAMVSQHAKGKYDVVGADDGRTYSATYIGTPQTGVVWNPSLISERGPEIIIDADRSRNIRMNYPELLSVIKSVPQHATGTVNASTSHSSLSIADNEIKALLAQNAQMLAMLNGQLAKGIKSKMVYSDYRNTVDKAEAIEGDTRRGR